MYIYICIWVCIYRYGFVFGFQPGICVHTPAPESHKKVDRRRPEKVNQNLPWCKAGLLKLFR